MDIISDLLPVHQELGKAAVLWYWTKMQGRKKAASLAKWADKAVVRVERPF